MIFLENSSPEFENDIRALAEPQRTADAGISLPADLFARWINDGNTMRDSLEDAGFIVDLRYADNNVETQQNQIGEMIDEGVREC